MSYSPPPRRNGSRAPSGSCQLSAWQSGHSPTSPLARQPLASKASSLPALKVFWQTAQCPSVVMKTPLGTDALRPKIRRLGFFSFGGGAGRGL